MSEPALVSLCGIAEVELDAPDCELVELEDDGFAL